MTKHGHGMPRKRPGRSANDEIEADLPELEPIEDLPVLESMDDLPELEAVDEVDEGPIKATCAACDADGFDTLVSVEVPEMSKAEVLAGVDAPLTRIAEAFGEQLRHKKVLVRFDGESLIGSAIKQVVADKLGPQKPLLVVVKRGFGDETVHQGSLPSVEMTHDVVDGITNVQIAVGDCEQQDLPLAMAPHMAKLSDSGRNARYVFQFRGGAKPDATMRDAMAMALREAGASSAAIGARVLFDREIEERVKCSVSGNRVAIAVSLTDDDETIIDALSLVLPAEAASLEGKNVRFQFARESAAVQAFCVDFARNSGATLVEVGGQDDTDIVWPPLISLRVAKEVELRLSPNGRSRAAVLAAFVSECDEHRDETADKHVVVDWPQDFALDPEALESVQAAIAKLSPSRLCCTIAGSDREPIHPLPVTVSTDGAVVVVGIDTEAGKPRELSRAVDRHLPAQTSAMNGQAVRVEFAGEAAVSRSLRQSVCTMVVDAGASRLELLEGGDLDVLLPPMLTVASGDGGLEISASIDGRDERQQRSAVARELEDVEVALQSVTITSSPAAEVLADYALEQGASRVVLGGDEPIQIHPPLFESAEKSGKEARFVTEPTGDASMDQRMLERELPGRIKDIGLLANAAVTIVWPGAAADHPAISKMVEALREKQVQAIKLAAQEGDIVQLYPAATPESVATPPAAAEPAAEAAGSAAAATPAALEAPTAKPSQPAAEGALVTMLGRQDAAVPPMVLIGVAAGEGDGHLSAVEAELGQHLPRLRGRAVLLIPQADGGDLPARRPNPLTTVATRLVSSSAAATLVFRGPDAQGRPHFQVLHSTLPTLPTGTNVGDPRVARQAT